MWGKISVIGVVVLLVFVPVSQTGGAVTASIDRSQAQPTEIESCTTITEPGRYVLATDIENSSRTACIEIRANDVVFDGNGHTIDGVQSTTQLREFVNASYTGLPPNETDDANLTPNATTNLSFPSPTDPEWANAGIAVNASDSLSNVSITAVTVREFFYGVYYDNVTAGTVQNVTIAGNGDGLDLFNSSSIQITASQFVENQWGLFTEGVTDSSIRAINASANGETGVYLYNSTMDVEEVTANANGASGVILDSVNDSTFVNVTANENRYDGIPLFLSENNTIRNSVTSGNGHAGISLNVESTENLVTNSTIANTTGQDDITASFGYSAAIVVSRASQDNTVRDTLSYNNTNWTFYANNTSQTNSVENLTIDSRVSVSFTGTSIALHTPESPRATDTERATLRSGLFVANTSQDARVENLRIEWLTRATTEETPTTEVTPVATTVRSDNKTTRRTTEE